MPFIVRLFVPIWAALCVYPSAAVVYVKVFYRFFPIAIIVLAWLNNRDKLRGSLVVYLGILFS